VHVVDAVAVNFGASSDRLTGAKPLGRRGQLRYKLGQVIDTLQVDFKCVPRIDFLQSDFKLWFAILTFVWAFSIVSYMTRI
jgi:hypothetical protein